MMLRRHELLPVVDPLGTEMWPRGAVALGEAAPLEIRLGVGRLDSAQPVEAREQRCGRVRAAPIDAGVAPPARDGVRLRRRHPVDELAEAVNYEASHFLQSSRTPIMPSRPALASTHGRFCQGGS